MNDKIIFSEYSRKRRQTPRPNRKRGDRPSGRLRPGRVVVLLAAIALAVWGAREGRDRLPEDVSLASLFPDGLTMPDFSRLRPSSPAAPSEAGDGNRTAEKSGRDAGAVATPAPAASSAPAASGPNGRPAESAPASDARAQTGAGAGTPGSSPEAAEAAVPAAPVSAEGVVKEGDTASSILSPYLSAQAIQELVDECADICPLSQIRAGNAYKLTIEDGELKYFQYDVSPEEKLVARRSGKRYAISREAIAYEAREAAVRGVVGTNLFDAVKQAGESPELALLLADIFAWDVDFCRDIQEGDSFKVVVERRFRRGTGAGYGRILAAEFVNDGEVYRAYLFEDGGKSSYYDEEGKSLRKMFLKAPLSFRAISSGYSANRMHPILNERRPHLAIDYAAPTGTEIWSPADGTVASTGRNKAAGNYLVLRHNGGYETRYNHLSGYAKGIRKGKMVAQGQVIAYVGSTGYATGPHLDYRMYKDGRPINPQKLKTAPAAPVPAARRELFRAEVGRLAALMAEEPAQAKASLVVPAASAQAARPERTAPKL